MSLSRCRETRCRGSWRLKFVALSLVAKAYVRCRVVVVAKRKYCRVPSFAQRYCFNIAPLCDQQISTTFCMLHNPNSTTLSSRDDPTSASPPHSPHTPDTWPPPIPVWGEGASKGWGRKTHPHTTWPAALVPQLIQQRRADSYSFPGVNSLNNFGHNKYF